MPGMEAMRAGAAVEAVGENAVVTPCSTALVLDWPPAQYETVMTKPVSITSAIIGCPPCVPLEISAPGSETTYAVFVRDGLSGGCKVRRTYHGEC